MDFRHFIDSSERLMEEVDQFTPTEEALLDNLRNINQDFQDFQRQESEGNHSSETIGIVCQLVFFGNCIKLTCCAGVLSKVLSEIESVESELPKSLRPKVKEIKSYIESLKETNQEIYSTIKEIKEKIKGYMPNDFKISGEEKDVLEMLKIDLEGNLETAEGDLEEAGKALTSFKSDLESHLLKEGIIKAANLAVTAVATYKAVNAAIGAFDFIKDTALVGEVGNASRVVANTEATATWTGSSWAFISTSTMCLYQVKSFLSKYDDLMAKWTELDAELNIMKGKNKKQVKQFPNLKRQMDNLKVQE